MRDQQNTSKNDRPLSQRLRQSYQWAHTFDSAGSTIIFPISRHESALRVSDELRILISCFPGNRAIATAEAIDQFLRRLAVERTQALVDRALVAIERLAAVGVLVSKDDASGHYTYRMASHYVRSRSVPREIATMIVDSGSVVSGTRILDIGTGTGSLALQLAETSTNVTGIDICQPFLKVAERTARSRGETINFVHACGNKLAFDNSEYDIVTACQVFHWLDPIWAARGLFRVLRENGYFFAIESKAVLVEGHPLNRLFGYGRQSHGAATNSCIEHAERYMQLFDVMGTTEWRIELDRSRIFHQRRPFDMDFARAYFFPDQLRKAMPEHKYPWRRLGRLFAQQPSPDALFGDMYWLLLRFRKRRPDSINTRESNIGSEVIDIPYSSAEETT